MKTFVLGDVHGAYKALLQVLKKSKFDYKNDKLICLGDTADGWPETPECFNELLKIKNLVYVLGNHDKWLLDYFNTGQTPHIWTSQGGSATQHAYERYKNMMRFDEIDVHQKLLENAHYYYLDDNNRLFVHGGFNWKVPIEEQHREYITWDRAMFKTALMWAHKKEGLKFPIYDEIYIGHTTVTSSSYFNKHYKQDNKPLFLTNLIALDTGGGMEGKLTIMNIDTKEYWQSDLVKELYPNEKGR